MPLLDSSILDLWTLVLFSKMKISFDVVMKTAASLAAVSPGSWPWLRSCFGYWPFVNNADQLLDPGSGHMVIPKRVPNTRFPGIAPAGPKTNQYLKWKEADPIKGIVSGGPACLFNNRCVNSGWGFFNSRFLIYRKPFPWSLQVLY